MHKNSDAMDPETQQLRAILRSRHPSFGRIDEIFVELLDDDSVSPKTFDLFCEALFIALSAFEEGRDPPTLTI